MGRTNPGMAKPAPTAGLPRRVLEHILGVASSPEIQRHGSGAEKVVLGCTTEEKYLSTSLRLF